MEKIIKINLINVATTSKHSHVILKTCAELCRLGLLNPCALGPPSSNRNFFRYNGQHRDQIV